MSPQQLIQSLWTESRACTLYWNIVYWRDFLPIPTGSAVCTVFGTITSSSILRAHPSSTVGSENKNSNADTAIGIGFFSFHKNRV